ncbi:hypothetical protein RCF65_08680, partial [Staphylococcus chromogenes]
TFISYYKIAMYCSFIYFSMALYFIIKRKYQNKIFKSTLSQKLISLFERLSLSKDKILSHFSDDGGVFFIVLAHPCA